MPITKLREIIAPIQIEQFNLNKFFHHLPKLENYSLPAESERNKAVSSDVRYTIGLRRCETIYIKETHCLTCDSRLVKNGYNDRSAILDNGLGKHDFRLQRK
jgi:hypothetical protein